jgi:hypothetical protein
LPSCVVDAAGHQIRERVVELVERLDLRVLLEAGIEERREVRTGLDADHTPLESRGYRAVDATPVAFRADEHRRRFVICTTEIDRLLPLAGDRHR